MVKVQTWHIEKLATFLVKLAGSLDLHVRVEHEQQRYAQQQSCVGIEVDADPMTQLIGDEVRVATSFPWQARVRARPSPGIWQKRRDGTCPGAAIRPREIRIGKPLGVNEELSVRFR